MLPKRSDPLTPRVNCFHFAGENRRMLRCLFFFFCFPPRDLSSRMQLQLQPVCSASFPRDPKHTDPETRSKSESEKQLLLSSFRPQITEPDVTRRSFSSAERVCYLAAGVPWDFCGVHFRRLLRQRRGAFIFGGGETSRRRRSLACWLLCSPENCAQNPRTCPRFKVFTIRWELHALNQTRKL